MARFWSMSNRITNRAFFAMFVFLQVFSAIVSHAQPCCVEWPTEYINDSTQVKNNVWRLSNTNLSEKKIFFFGESHGVLSNPMLHYNTFLTLYYNANVRYYIMEGHYGYAYFINQYIQSGDSTLLNVLDSHLDSHLDDKDYNILKAAFNEYHKKLYEFNKGLPKNQKITVTGIDTEPFFYTNEMICNILKNKPRPPESLSVSLDILKRFKVDRAYIFLPKKQRKEIKGVLSKLKGEYQKHYLDFKNYFNEDLVHIEHIINNPATLKRSDKNLHKNFIKFQNDSSRMGNSYIQYGNLHAQKKEVTWPTGLASLTMERWFRLEHITIIVITGTANPIEGKLLGQLASCRVACKASITRLWNRILMGLPFGWLIYTTCLRKVKT